MTRQHNGFGEPTPFSEWLRALPAPLNSRTVSNQNLDYVWHDYRRNYILTIEEKRFGRAPTSAQKDTHGVITQMLAMADGKSVITLKGMRPVRYFGHYVVRFENTQPDDGRLWINGRLCTRDRLVKLLEFDVETTDVLRDAA